MLFWSVCAMATAVLAAGCFLPAVALQGRARLAAVLVLGTVVALSPTLVPLEAKLARLLATGFALILLLKMWDLYVGALLGQSSTIRQGFAFYANPFFLVSRRYGRERQPATPRNILDLSLGTLGVGAACSAMIALLKIDWSGLPFLLEHGAKAFVIFVFALALFKAFVAVTRLAGGYVLGFSHWPLTSRTPAEFWRRYNRLVGQFLYEDVFKPMRGRRNAALATMGVFLVSGLIHEYLFAMVIGRPQGYQMAFFTLQGCAVALTMGVKPTGGRAVAWRIGTLAFNLLSSVFFFASGQSVIRIYQGGLPAWLAGW